MEKPTKYYVKQNVRRHVTTEKNGKPSKNYLACPDFRPNNKKKEDQMVVCPNAHTATELDLTPIPKKIKNMEETHAIN